MVFPKPTETVVLKVNGVNYKDWESVQVIHSVDKGTPPWRFRFTCSEFQPVAKAYNVLRIKPGDPCTIELAGHLAFTGFVIIRQVFYDAYRHYIEIQGASDAHQAARTSVVHKSGEMKDVDFHQVARALLKPIGVGYRTIGKAIANHKFPRVSFMPTQTVYDVLETLGRQVGAMFTSDPEGNFVVTGGAPEGQGGDSVIEGINIIEGREIIRDEQYASGGPHIGQLQGTDAKHGPDVSHKPFYDQETQNEIARQGIVTTLSEIPAWNKGQMQSRAEFETQQQDFESIIVTVVVHGWLKPSGGLWDVNKTVFVKSPMLIMNRSLYLQKVIFSQDNQGGSVSTLELTNKPAGGGPYIGPLQPPG